MKLTVRTPVSQKRVEISDISQLDSAIKDKFKVEEYQLFSDVERKNPLNPASLSDGSLIFMSYELEQPKIYRDENTCTHDPRVICPKCASLDPFERLKQADNEKVEVKYLSYDSYKELLDNKSEQEPIYDYQIKKCDNHPENAQCSRCMEKVITLVPQIFRHIDYVEFDNSVCVETFIQRWYNSARQQVGLLVGRILPYDLFPKAKKAVVSGIWEITQEKFPDGVALQSLPSEFICDELEIVGVIYTDLFMKNSSLYSYKDARNYIISTAELNFIHEVQAQLKKKEFVGICVRPKESEIILECFMISEQFKALMNVYAFELTTDPANFYTRRPMKYMIRNEYDKIVPKENSSIIPVDYFVVKCESGYMNAPMFKSTEVLAKPTFYRLACYFNGDFSFEKFHNFSVLMAISRHFSGTGKLMSAIIADDREAFDEIAKSEKFREVLQKIQEACEGTWNCLACTYINSANSTNCEMCNTSRGN